MTMHKHDVARAFSGHRFEETFDRLAEDAVWNLVGEARLEGRAAVIDVCRATTDELRGATVTWLRFVSTGDGDVVAVDVVGRYADATGVAEVASCDVDEFSGGRITAVTSYAVELRPDDPQLTGIAEP